MMRLYYDETLSPRLACTVARQPALPIAYMRVRLGQGGHKAPDAIAAATAGFRRVAAIMGANLVGEATQAFEAVIADAQAFLPPLAG